MRPRQIWLPQSLIILKRKLAMKFQRRYPRWNLAVFRRKCLSKLLWVKFAMLNVRVSSLNIKTVLVKSSMVSLSALNMGISLSIWAAPRVSSAATKLCRAKM